MAFGQQLYLVVSCYGISGIHFDLDGAIEQAREIHESAEDVEFFVPVWVLSMFEGPDDTTMMLGMFPDRREDSPGEWTPSVNGGDLPWPEITVTLRQLPPKIT